MACSSSRPHSHSQIKSGVRHGGNSSPSVRSRISEGEKGHLQGSCSLGKVGRGNSTPPAVNVVLLGGRSSLGSSFGSTLTRMRMNLPASSFANLLIKIRSSKLGTIDTNPKGSTTVSHTAGIFANLLARVGLPPKMTTTTTTMTWTRNPRGSSSHTTVRCG